MAKTYYLDANAHVPLLPNAAKAYINTVNSIAGHGHPSSPSVPGRAAATTIESAREKIAELIGAQKSNQIIFTSSCSQACEWAIKIIKHLNFEYNYISPLEHTAVKDAAETLSGLEFIPLDSDFEGIIDKTFMASGDCSEICIHVQNEIGTIQPLEYLDGSFIFSDMSQALGKIPINVTNLDIDMAAFGAHKFGGPGGVGFLYIKDTNVWQEFGTGSRYFMDRPGTPDIAGVVAASVALEEMINTLPERTEKMITFQTALEGYLTEIFDFDVIGSAAKRSPNTTFVNIPNCAFLLMNYLAERNIHVGLGSACGSAHAGPSPLMTRLSRSGGIHDYLRISQMGEYDHNDAIYIAGVIEQYLKESGEG